MVELYEIGGNGDSRLGISDNGSYDLWGIVLIVKMVMADNIMMAGYWHNIKSRQKSNSSLN